MAGISPHRGLDAEHVATKLLGLGHRGHELPGLIASRVPQVQMRWDRRAGREIWRSRGPSHDFVVGTPVDVDLGGGTPLGAPPKAGGCDGTGPLTRGSGRMGSKDPAGISGLISISPSAQ